MPSANPLRRRLPLVHHDDAMNKGKKGMQLTLSAAVAVFLGMFGSGVLGQQLETIYSFDGMPAVGPAARLVQGRDGHLYGTAHARGEEEPQRAFRITHRGEITVLARLNYITKVEEALNPNDSTRLIQGSDGNFYGTAIGDEEAEGFPGRLDNDKGAVFKMTPQGFVTTLLRFDGTNGSYPAAELLQGTDSNFYGTTLRGGANNSGTVFKITSNGILTTLISFKGTNGYRPQSPLIETRDGFFYGTTAQQFYGDNSGLIFRMALDGSWTNVVSTGGARPNALLEDADGSFYGTLLNFSDFDVPRWGYIFKLTPPGAFTNLWQFGLPGGASGPMDSLVHSRDGNFYGVTFQGGENGKGTVFKLTREGALTIVVSFNGANGANPLAGLTVGSDGNLYGTTSAGGVHNAGTVFRIRLTPSLSVRRGGGGVVISWPANFVEVALQSTSDLTAPVMWTDATGSFPETAGEISTTNITSGRARFFRLRRK
jgi:uncharacterized repeat protein (TIGR03803 family)